MSSPCSVQHRLVDFLARYALVCCGPSAADTGWDHVRVPGLKQDRFFLNVDDF